MMINKSDPFLLCARTINNTIWIYWLFAASCSNNSPFFVSDLSLSHLRQRSRIVILDFSQCSKPFSDEITKAINQIRCVATYKGCQKCQYVFDSTR